jgi:pimeloyl-ACP methyl ester carboxylesterase
LAAAQRPTLLLLPGTLCDDRVWNQQRRALSPDWPCAIVDYGAADSINAMAANALAEHAGSLIPVGLSMGGMVALEIWRQASNRVVAMALFDTDCGADTNERRQNRDAQILAAVHGDFRDMVETQLLPSYFSADSVSNAKTHQALREAVIAMALSLGVATFAAQITALATREDSWPLLKDISIPTLVACGADDRICTPDSHRRMASAMRLTAFAQIDNAGHLPTIEQPAHTTNVLRSWLETLEH